MMIYVWENPRGANGEVTLVNIDALEFSSIAIAQIS